MLDFSPLTAQQQQALHIIIILSYVQFRVTVKPRYYDTQITLWRISHVNRVNFLHSKLCSITHVAITVHVILWSFVMFTWMCDTMEEHKGDVRTIWICSPVAYPGVVTPHVLTHGTMRGCGLGYVVVCINDNFCDIRERNLTIKSEIWTTNIRSLGF